jgi:cytochrome c oxidase subunit 2
LQVLPVAALLLLVGLLAACGNPTDAPQSTIAQDGANNARIWDVYNILWIGAAIVFVLVEGLLFYTVFRYRRRPRTAHGRPVPVHGNTKLEIIWTIIPAVVLVIIAVPTLQIMADLNDVPDEENALKVEVIGHQFFFEFRYEDLDLSSASTLVIPEDTTVDIKLRSADVIHSFWVPRLAGKTDNIPGRTNHMWLSADDVGIYNGQCAEFCGLGHGLMRFKVDVRSQADFQAWVTEQQNPAAQGDPAVGEQLVVAGACAGCHAIEGTTAQGAVGPALTGFADRPQIAGVLENTPENLATWLANPPAAKPGTLMPNLGLSEADIRHIVAYLETLTGQ